MRTQHLLQSRARLRQVGEVRMRPFPLGRDKVARETMLACNAAIRPRRCQLGPAGASDDHEQPDAAVAGGLVPDLWTGKGARTNM